MNGDLAYLMRGGALLLVIVVGLIGGPAAAGWTILGLVALSVVYCCIAALLEYY